MKWRHLILTILIAISVFATNCRMEDIVSSQSPMTEASPSNKDTELTASKINEISKGLTVLIDGYSSFSGVIVSSSSNGTYYVLAIQHSMTLPGDYNVVTPDGSRYPVIPENIKKISDVDLVLIPFSSDKVYPVPQFLDIDTLEEGEPIYISGFHKSDVNYAINDYRRLFSPGEITSISSTQQTQNGYTLNYKVRTLSGMNGGPIFNGKGQLVGIHAKEGLGIPIHYFIAIAPELGINIASQTISPQVSSVNKPVLLWEKNILWDKTTYEQNSLHIRNLEGFNLLSFKRNKKDGELDNTLKINGFNNDGSESSKITLSKAVFCEGVLLSTRKAVIDKYNNIYTFGFYAPYIPNGSYPPEVDDEKSRICLIKYDNNGTFSWQKQVTGIKLSEYSSLIGVVAGEENNLYVLLEGNKDNALLIKFDKNGSLIWNKEWNTLQEDFLKDIKTDSSGNVYVAGMATLIPEENNFPGERPPQEAKVWLTKFDSEGSLLWQKQWKTLFNHIEPDLKISVDATGNIYVGGDTLSVLTGSNSGEVDVWLIKFNSNGTVLWQKQWGSSESDFIGDVEINSSLEVYILSLTDEPKANDVTTRVLVTKYNSDGSLLWEVECKDLPYSSQTYFEGFDLTLDKSENFYVTGVTYLPTDEQPELISPSGQWILKFSES